MNSTLEYLNVICLSFVDSVDHFLASVFLNLTLLFDPNPLLNNTQPAMDFGETWFIGILTGLIWIFILLAYLSKIRPYILSGFWFVALMALYIWRSDYMEFVLPNLVKSPYFDIILFVLQCLPLIIFLVINKVISVLRARELVIFSKIFTTAIWVSVGYLVLVILLSLMSTGLVVNNLEVVQSIFWVILTFDGFLFLFWLIFSSKNNNDFLRFQSTFGVLFLVSVGGKLYMSATSFSTTYLKPRYILWGIAAQLLYIYWLLLKEVFKNWDTESSDNTLDFENKKPSQQPKISPINREAKAHLLESLSPRERDIFLAYCNGFSYTDISSSYFISPNTVKTHLKNCYRKLEINSKVEAIAIVNTLSEEKL